MDSKIVKNPSPLKPVNDWLVYLLNSLMKTTFLLVLVFTLLSACTASRPVAMVQPAPRLLQPRSVVTRVVVVPAAQPRRISKYQVRRTPWRGYF